MTIKYKITEENNFCRVFQLPSVYPEVFCFGGPVPVMIHMIDWFRPVDLRLPAAKERLTMEDLQFLLIPWLRRKSWVKSGITYLLLFDFGTSFTFVG